MWKFLPGVSKPESKRKVVTGESNKAYDATKRKTTFQSHWHNICTSHIFKTYSECRILHVIIKNVQGGACPPPADSGRKTTLTANTGLDIFLQG
jgi:hypothetical protein